MYFGTNGLFVCPDNGIYIFIWSVLMAPGSSSRCLTSLTIGGNEIKYGPKTSYPYYGQGSGLNQMTAVVQCRSAPLAAVAVVSGINPAPTYIGFGYSTFSGYRLAPVALAVGFTAELSSGQPLFPGNKIVFDRVISNFGDNYNAQHGYFRCPDSSIYSFTISAHFPEHDNQWSVSKLVFDGETVLHGPITVRVTQADDSGSSSVTAIAQCEQGKDVYVEAKEAYTFPYNVYGARLTSFSGARLCSTDCDDYVAFSAVLSNNVTSTNSILIYDHILINQGGAYNQSDGIFTCPDDKLYLFTWSATMISGGSWVDLHYNSIRTKLNFITHTPYEDSLGTSGTCSQSTIIRCSADDTLYLHLASSVSPVLLADYSVFSGYQIPGQ